MRRSSPLPVHFMLMVIGLTAPAAAIAQSSTSILDCAEIAGADERLGCFDREAERLKSRLESRELILIERAQLQASERAQFGLPAAQQQSAVVDSVSAAGVPAGQSAARADRTAQSSDPIQSIDAKVVDVIRAVDGMFVLQLDDQSIWRTTEAHRSFYPKPGQSLTIWKASLGSFLMKTDKSRPVRARRMR